MIEHLKFEAFKTCRSADLAEVHRLSCMQRCGFLWEGLRNSPGHSSVGEPPDPMDIIEKNLIEAKWFLAEPVMLFRASTSTFKNLSTQVFNSMTAETLLKLS